MKNYSTKDFYLSAFLMASGQVPTSYTKNNGITMFHFADDGEVGRLVTGYFAMTLTVLPTKYASALKHLKSIIRADYYENEYENYVKQPITSR